MNIRLLTYDSARGPRAGIAAGPVFLDAADATGNHADETIVGILQEWDAALPRIEAVISRGMDSARELSGTKLLPPVLYPGTIYCAGANYKDHVARMSEKLNLPQEPDPHLAGLMPWHFIKPSRTAIGNDGIVSVRSSKLDWEVELAVVLGRRARNVSVVDALNYVAGYTVANDLSARDLITRPNVPIESPFRYDWIGQKCFDGSCPLGPFLVPAREVPDPQNLGIRLRVNGKLMQDSNTSQMIFSAAEQIAHLSSRLILYPGDIILTGTPAGTGAEAGRFLAEGDLVTAEIDGLGALNTRIGRLHD
jgi:2-keto-4-pentenoate hydratase/2-oxohepta-3-ene-1,7-dioic acid hydratase in catechol pathway